MRQAFIFATGCSILISGLSNDLKQVSAETVSRSQASSISDGDADAIVAYCNLPRRWNRAAAHLVRDYLDPNVSGAKWVKDASVHIGELRSVHMQMYTSVLAISNPGIRGTFESFTDNYRAKLDALTMLHNAVASGDEKREYEAQQALAEAGAEGMKLARTFLERVRPHVDPKVFSEELRKRGKEIGDLMKPQ